MKLKNKKTGEWCNFNMTPTEVYSTTPYRKYYYNSLAELNEEWEDYEEPKEKYWYMTSWGEVWQYGDDPLHEEWRILLGNDFETKEEAELAARKLKAWKRLKDKGFKFGRWQFLDDRSGIWVQGNLVPDIVDELDILFGGEE